MAPSAGIIIVLIEAFAPAFIIGWLIYRSDTVEKEPVGLLVAIFVLSMLLALSAATLEGVLGALFFPNGGMSSIFALFAYYILVVGLVEEITKCLAALIPAWRHRAFDHNYDAIVYCVISALGFAGFENVFYIMDYGHGVVIARALLAVPFHASCGLIMGVFIGRAKAYALAGYNPGRVRNTFYAIIIPAIIHGIYDASATLASLGALSTMTFLTAVVSVFIAVLAIRFSKHKEDKPIEQEAAEIFAEEVQQNAALQQAQVAKQMSVARQQQAAAMDKIPQTPGLAYSDAPNSLIDSIADAAQLEAMAAAKADELAAQAAREQAEFQKLIQE